VQRAHRGEQGLAELRAWLDARCAHVAATGERCRVDPFSIYPLDPETQGYTDGVLRKHADFGVDVDVGFGDSLLAFAPELRLDAHAGTPLLVAHGDRNLLHPVEEARALLAKYPGPKEALWVPDANHTEWMLDDHPKFALLVDGIERWLHATIG
jgi:pimeloyl-ACP methyl ester carboxylesterase